MPLTDVAIRNAKPRDTAYKLTDSAGLFVYITPKGAKLWRLKYRFGNKEKLLSIGPYPTVSLADARAQRDEAKRLLLKAVDPGLEKKRTKLAALTDADTTFGLLAEEFITRQEKEGKASQTVEKLRWQLLTLAAALKPLPITQITSAEVLDVLRKLEARGLRETTIRCRASISRLFRYAMATGRATADPTYALQKGTLLKAKTKHHAALTDPKKVGAMMRAIGSLEGSFVVRRALELLALCYPRPGELRHANWLEFDLDKAVWIIPAERMKMKVEHAIPLPRQAVELLREVKEVIGGEGLVFPGMRNARRALSENTLNVALRRLGYSSEEMCSHGFRTTASTLLNESGKWHPDAIERSLAHVDRNAVRGSYARGAFWNERVEMAQWWADELGRLARPAPTAV